MTTKKNSSGRSNRKALLPGRVNLSLLDGPRARATDADVPRLTMRQLREFRPVSAVTRRKSIAAPNVAELRKSLSMSQAVFAEIFRLSVATIRDWEARRRRPDGPAQILLHVIAKEPDAVRRALG